MELIGGMMPICRSCQKETSDASVTTCTENTHIKYPGGAILQAIPFDPKRLHLPQWYRCPECNVVPGGNHHANCDLAHCPKCGGQLIGCACFDVEGE